MSPSAWKFPFKPVRVSESHFAKLDPSQYTMERKFDGWRAIVTVTNGTASLWTREKARIEMPDNIKVQLHELGLPDGTILDGEIWNPTKRGSWRHDHTTPCMLTLWDVIRVGSVDYGQMPIEGRREMLRHIVKPVPEIKTVEVLAATRPEYDRVLGEATELREVSAARSGFIHGVVLKRNGSPRRDHATRCAEHPDWLKVLFPGMKGWEPR